MYVFPRKKVTYHGGQVGDQAGKFSRQWVKAGRICDPTVDGKPIYRKSGFKCLRSLVSVYPGYLGGTLLKCTRWLLKLDTHTTMNTFFPFFFRKVPSNHRRCLEWKLSRYIKGLCLRLSNNEFLDPVFQQHRNFLQTPYAWRKIVPWNRVILQCRI